MTPSPSSTTESNPYSLIVRMGLGALIGLMVISFFLFPVSTPDPTWGKYWMIRPLIVTPLAGAMGGLCNYFIMNFSKKVGINKTVAIIVSALVFLIGLWMGIIVGLDGTLWD